MSQRRLSSRLWGLVRRHPGGEQTLRDVIAAIHDEDGTNQAARGTDAYTSTKTLTDKQLARAVDRLDEGAAPRKRRRSKGDKQVKFFISGGERSYLGVLKSKLRWSKDAYREFCERQIKKPAPQTHNEATALIEPMERMLAERGWKLTEYPGGGKWWDPPEGETP